MDIDAITQYLTTSLEGVDVLIGSAEAGSPEIAWGDVFFIYDPDRVLEGARQFPFATIVTKDYGEFDNASNLDRPGVFRLNIGVGKETFDSMFGGGGEFDYAAIDRLMPHPVYGPNHWVCILNPGDRSFEATKPLLAEAHGIAVKRYTRPRRGPRSNSRPGRTVSSL